MNSQSTSANLNSLPKIDDNHLFKTDDIVFCNSEVSKLTKLRQKQFYKRLTLIEKFNEDNKKERYTRIKNKLDHIKDTTYPDRSQLDSFTQDPTFRTRLKALVQKQEADTNNFRTANPDEKIVQDKSVRKFLQDNKHISLNNFFIALLEKERKTLKDYAENKSKALEKNYLKLDQEHKLFSQYIQTEKRKRAEKETQLAREKQQLTEDEEKLKRENLVFKTKREERNRKIRSIMNLKVNRNFVHYVFELEDSFDENVDFNIKQADYEEIGAQLIDEFSQTDTNLDSAIEDVFRDEDALNDKVEQLKENILKSISRVQTLDSELIQMRKDQEFVMKESAKKHAILVEQYEHFKEEELKTDLTMKKLNKTRETDNTKQVMRMFKELLSIVESDSLIINSSPVEEMFNQTKGLELKVKSLIKRLEEFEAEEPEKFKKQVGTRRAFNRIKKIEKQKEKDKEIREEKMRKTQERMKRQVVKGKPLQRRYNIDDAMEEIREERVEEESNDDDLIEYTEDD